MKKKKSAARVALPASHKTAPKGAKLAGKISPKERLEVIVRLRRKPGAGIPKVGGVPLTREEFRANYGADPADIEKVGEFANEHGLDVVQSSIAQRSVRLSGTVEAMQAAFGVRFKAYGTTITKQSFRGRTGTISVPKELARSSRACSASTTVRRRGPTFAFARTKGGFRAAGRRREADDAARSREALQLPDQPRRQRPVHRDHRAGRRLPHKGSHRLLQESRDQEAARSRRFRWAAGTTSRMGRPKMPTAR